MNEKKLTLIRHTQPDIAPGICYGQTDVGVAENFAGEAAAVANWVQSVDLLIASPLARTQRLAEYLSGVFSCDWRADARLMELNFGEWEGQNWSGIPRYDLDAWGADILHFTPPGGESATQLMLRVKMALSDVMILPYQHVALIAHAGSLRAVLSLLGDVSLSNVMTWEIGYGAVIELKVT